MKAHPAFTEEHEAFRETVRRFVERNFNAERLSMAAGAVGFAQACLEDALAWAARASSAARAPSASTARRR